MINKLIQIDKLCNLNTSSLRGMIKILKPIEADEAAAVRLMLAQLLQINADIKSTAKSIQPKKKSVDWAAITEDIE